MFSMCCFFPAKGRPRPRWEADAEERGQRGRPTRKNEADAGEPRPMWEGRKQEPWAERTTDKSRGRDSLWNRELPRRLRSWGCSREQGVLVMELEPRQELLVAELEAGRSRELDVGTLLDVVGRPWELEAPSLLREREGERVKQRGWDAVGNRTGVGLEIRSWGRPKDGVGSRHQEHGGGAGPHPSLMPLASQAAEWKGEGERKGGRALSKLGGSGGRCGRSWRRLGRRQRQKQGMLVFSMKRSRGVRVFHETKQGPQLRERKRGRERERVGGVGGPGSRFWMPEVTHMDVGLEIRKVSEYLKGAPC